MRLASRMELIGTETAFEAAARARALEATGREVDPPRDRRARLRHAGQRPGGGQAGARRGQDPLRAVPRHPGAARRDRRRRHAPARASRSRPSSVFVTVGGKGVMFYAIMALVDPGDEVIVPDPGYPIYESASPGSSAARPVPIPIRQENDFRLDLDELVVAGHAAHQDDRPQLAGQPDRRRAHARRPRADRRARRRARPGRPVRRDLRPHPLRGRARLDRDACPAWPSARSCSTASPRPTP